MRPGSVLRNLLGPAAAFAALAAPPATATTIVPLSDAALVARSPLVLTGRVEGTLPASDPGPYTDWLVTVDRVLKGELAGSAIVVRVLGGETAQGGQLVIHGAPRFAEREQVLLFLAPRPDGTFRIAQYLQGAFHAVRAGSRTAAVRNLTEVEVVGGRRRRGGTPPRLREFGAFADWVEDVAAGLRPPRDYFFRPSASQMRAIIGRFTLFENGGLNMRWFEFDGGGSVTWRAHQGGQPGLAGGGFQEFQRALGAWNAEATTPVHLLYGGTSNDTSGFLDFDRQNVLLFDDPNQEIEGTFDCSEGGTLAIGGPWIDAAATGRFGGRTFIRIQAGDVVMNDGIECLFPRARDASKLVEEVYAHELGHTLGIGHSSENENETSNTLRQALMFFQAHSDARGARFNSDDVAALQALYKRPGGGGGGGGSNCPAGILCLNEGRFHVSVTWDNQFNGNSGTGGPVRNTDVSGFFYFDDGANIELIVKILDFGDVFKVFYGQLTNLHFTMTVADTLTGASKTYLNTAGECGAIDNNAFPTGAAVRARRRGHRSRSVLGGTCRPDATTLCLQGNRIKVTGTWRNQYQNTSGVAQMSPLSAVTGGLYFLDRSNLEVLVKAVDFGSYYLLIYGSLSDFGYDLTVTDTVSGTTKTFQNPPGRYCGAIDGETFRK